MKKSLQPNFIFFGTPRIAVTILNVLETQGLTPSLVVTQSDKRAGRGNTLVAPEVKEWALARNIEVFQPEKIDAEAIDFLKTHAKTTDVTCFVVAAYGVILPQSLLDIPPHGTLNVHPSLLPRLRGPSPIQSAIRTGEKEVGVSIMLLDEKMDHGPLIAQKKVVPHMWPMGAKDLEDLLAKEGAELLATLLPEWIKNTIDARPQQHDLATYCSLLKKEDGLIDILKGDAHENERIVKAYEEWPIAYTFFERNGTRVRVQILTAEVHDGVFTPLLVKPEGKNSMPYSDFVRSGAAPVSP